MKKDLATLRLTRLGINTYKEAILYMREDCHICRAEGFEVHAPNLQAYRECTPIIADDIISTGHTMIAAIKCLQAAGMNSPICIGVPAVFADNVVAALTAAGAAEIVTCNTIMHPSNQIDLAEDIVAALATFTPN